jgi:hypothetical protein
VSPIPSPQRLNLVLSLVFIIKTFSKAVLFNHALNRKVLHPEIEMSTQGLVIINLPENKRYTSLDLFSYSLKIYLSMLHLSSNTYSSCSRHVWEVWILIRLA